MRNQNEYHHAVLPSIRVELQRFIHDCEVVKGCLPTETNQKSKLFVAEATGVEPVRDCGATI